MLRLNESMLNEWISCNGDNTKLINYDLDEKSKVLELGGYDGTWIRKIISRYNPHTYMIEPVPSYFDSINAEFGGNDKFHSMNVAVSSKSGEGEIYLNNDSTSIHVKEGKMVNIKMETMENILSYFQLDEVDLLQVNIEGGEYELLENLISNGLIDKFKNIQVQFHIGMPDYENRRSNIQNGLTSRGFIKNFDFPFIWEGWTRTNTL